MKKIGVLFGQENTFPGALVEKINSMEIDGLTAEFVHLGGVHLGVPSGYRRDRGPDLARSCRSTAPYLKNAVLNGTQVINNPFWWSADDKFFNYALAEKLGVAVPRTVLLPHKDFPPDINAQSLRNLEYPLDWEGIFDYVKFPGIPEGRMTAVDGGMSSMYTIPNEFFHAYHQTRDLCMTLQAAVNFKEYFRCYVVGQSEVRIMAYDPKRPHAERYVMGPNTADKKLLKRVEKDALTLCKALGYDLNTVEFAVEDGIPYAIDFMNPAPDADLHSVGRESFDWIVDSVARLAVKKAKASDKVTTGMNWSAFLSGTTVAKIAPKKVAAKKAVKKAAKKKG